MKVEAEEYKKEAAIEPKFETDIQISINEGEGLSNISGNTNGQEHTNDSHDESEELLVETRSFEDDTATDLDYSASLYDLDTDSAGDFFMNGQFDIGAEIKKGIKKGLGIGADLDLTTTTNVTGDPDPETETETETAMKLTSERHNGHTIVPTMEKWSFVVQKPSESKHLSPRLRKAGQAIAGSGAPHRNRN